jgi:hypothetical protein
VQVFLEREEDVLAAGMPPFVGWHADHPEPPV